MNNSSSLVYVVFEEYLDASHPTSKGYVLGNANLLQNNCQDIQSIIESYFDVLDFFSYEDAKYIYDQDNLSGLLFPLSTLPDEYPGEEEELLASLSAHGFIEASDLEPSPSVGNIQYLHFNVTNDLFGRMICCNQDGEKVVLFHRNAVVSANSILTFSLSNTGGHIDIESCDDIRGLHSWFSKNRKTPRKYKFNPKHGNSNTPCQNIQDGSGVPAAQLEASDADAQDLLNQAVGHKRDAILWFWDDKVQKYIVFRYQGKNTLNEYHCYHLSPAQKGFKDIDLEKVKVIKPNAKP